MRTQQIKYSDLSLAIPVLLYPIEPISDEGIIFLEKLCSEFSFQIDADLERLLKEREYNVCKNVRAKIYVMRTAEDFQILRQRLAFEPGLRFFNYFCVTAFVDYKVNQDIEGAREIAKKLFFLDKDISSLIIYRGIDSQDLLNEFSANTHISFSIYNDERAIGSIQTFLSNQLCRSITNKIRKVPKGQSETRKRKYIFQFVSSDKEEQIDGFSKMLKEKLKEDDKHYLAILLEIMGLFEMENEGELRERRILSQIPSEKYWEYELNASSNLSTSSNLLQSNSSIASSNNSIPGTPRNATTNLDSPLVQSGSLMQQSTPGSSMQLLSSSHADVSFLFSKAAWYYSQYQKRDKSKNDKVFDGKVQEISDRFKIIDCAFHILSVFDNKKLLSDTINLIFEAADSSNINYSDKYLKQFLLRAWEMVTILIHLNYQRRVPLYTYLVSTKLKGNAQIDFQIQTLNMMYIQKPGDVIARDICFPILTNLLSDESTLKPLSKCQLILQFLSISGKFIGKDEQAALFFSLFSNKLGDIRIACNFGFKTSAAQFMPRTNQIRILKENPQSDSTSGPFKYNYLAKMKKKDTTSCIVPMGSYASISFSVFNPFQIDLSVLICAHDNDNYYSDVFPHVLKANSETVVHCNVIPKSISPDNKPFEIESVDVIIAQALQKLKLNALLPPKSKNTEKKLTLKAIPNVPEFATRTNLPLSQELDLFDGEILDVELWLNNTSKISIDHMNIQLVDKSKKEGKNDLSILPFSSVKTEFEFEINRAMSSLVLDISARSDQCPRAESYTQIIQPLSVQPGVFISSISLLDTIPEIDVDLSNIIFIALDIKNASSVVFNYSVYFKAAVDLGHEFPGILTKNKINGLLTENETTTFILAVEKDKIITDSLKVDDERFVEARKEEEKRCNGRPTHQQIQFVKNRVRAAVFIENNLVFEWTCGSGGRKGRIPINTAVPDPEVIHEINRKRPKITHQFDSPSLVINKRVNLNLKFENAKIVSCILHLGVFSDSDYGIAWDGTLEKSENDAIGENEYQFGLFFVKSGKFDLKVKYETEDKLTGHVRITADVSESDL